MTAKGILLALLPKESPYNKTVLNETLLEAKRFCGKARIIINNSNPDLLEKDLEKITQIPNLISILKKHCSCVRAVRGEDSFFFSGYLDLNEEREEWLNAV